MRAAGYIRVSEARDGGISPSIQRDEIARYAAAHNLDVIHWYEDLDISGRTDARPGLQALLAAAHDVDAVVAYRLDRFSREPLHYYQMVHALTAAGVELHDAGEARHEDTPETDFMRGIKILIAKQESRNIGRRAEATHRRLAKLGRWGGGLAPYGWRRVQDAGGIHLELDAEAAHWRRWMHECLWAGWSCSRIARELNVRGVRTRRGKPWSSGIVWVALRSPVQVGAREVDGELVTGGNITPLLTEEELARTCALLPARRGRSGRPSPVPLPSHVLRCGTCGGKMSTRWTRGAPYFMCTNRHLGLCAHGVSIQSRNASDEVERQMLARVGGRRTWKRPASPKAASEMTAARTEVARARDTLTRLHLMRAEGQIEPREYEDAVRVQRGRLEALEQRLARAEARIDEDAKHTTLAALADDLARMRSLWPGLTLEARRDIMGLLVREVLVLPGHHPTRERLRIRWV